MKPAWDKLGDEYADSSSLIIADVDCTANGKDLCTKYDVKGYPTIKYFIDGDTEGQDYKGGRDYDSMQKFVDENMAAQCDAKNPVDCSDKEKAYVEKMTAKSEADRQAQLTRLQNMAGAVMTSELLKWKNQRINILTSLTAAAKDEL